jgi:hypothetical protein
MAERDTAGWSQPDSRPSEKTPEGPILLMTLLMEELHFREIRLVGTNIKYKFAATIDYSTSVCAGSALVSLTYTLV